MASDFDSKRRHRLFLAVAIAAGILCLATELPKLVSFDSWTQSDFGGHLTLVELLDKGYKPNVDFSYSYGPLTVLVTESWAKRFGNAWQSYFALLVVLKTCQFLVAVALAREVARTLELRFAYLVGLIWFVLAHPGVAHSLERLCLSCAILAAVRGRYSLALTACVLAVGSRPAVGYLVALVVVAAIARQTWKSFTETGSTAVGLRQFLPAALAVAAIVIAYSLWFGVHSFLATAFPFAGMRMYRTQSTLFDHGLNAFLAPGMNFKWYLSNPSALVLASFACMIVGTTVAGIKFLSRGAACASFEFPRLLPWCALVVLPSVLFAYCGGLVYHYYVPFIWMRAIASIDGLLCRATLLRCATSLAVVGALLVCVSGSAFVFSRTLSSSDFDTKTRLLVDRTALAELSRVRNLTQDRPIAFLPHMGSNRELLELGVNANELPYWCLQTNLNTDEELDRIRKTARRAPFALFVVGSVPTRELVSSSNDSTVVFSGVRYELWKWK